MAKKKNDNGGVKAMVTCATEEVFSTINFTANMLNERGHSITRAYIRGVRKIKSDNIFVTIRDGVGYTGKKTKNTDNNNRLIKRKDESATTYEIRINWSSNDQAEMFLDYLKTDPNFGNGFSWEVRRFTTVNNKNGAVCVWETKAKGVKKNRTVDVILLSADGIKATNLSQNDMFDKVGGLFNRKCETVPTVKESAPRIVNMCPYEAKHTKGVRILSPGEKIA